MCTGALELEINSQSWEAHLVKCSCTVIKCPTAVQQSQRQSQAQQQQQQTQVQQQQPGVGEKVFVMLNSKSGHSVELRPGSRVHLHPPWHVVQQGPGVAKVLLGYFVS